MGERVKLTAADGHNFDAYVAQPQGEPLAGLVVVQEIFGVNEHIRAVTDDFASDGFLAVSPAIFDRIEPGIELGYDTAGMQKAMGLFPKLDMDKAVQDVAATLDYVAKTTQMKVGIIGYCFGGTMAWLAATRLRPSVAVGYYGGRIPTYAAEIPNAPVMLHFGKDDAHIPASEVDKVKSAHPEVEIYWYEKAGHAFNRPAAPGYNADAAQLARQRSLDFLKKYLA
jgi:carboxymethylenebutenolidase